MEIRRTIRVPEWTDKVRRKIEEYWRGRGVVLAQVGDGQMSGRRGSLWGNLMSLHIAKVLSTVTITRTADGIECVVDIDARYRGVTKQNRTYVELELAVLESYLATGDMQPEAWKQHRRTSSKASGELMGQAMRSIYLRRGPLPIAGDLKFKAWMLAVFAVALPPIMLIYGSSLYKLIEGVRGRHLRPSAAAFGAALFGPVAAVFFGILFGAMALWMLKVRRQSATCLSVEQAAERLGVDADLMQRSITERKIQPRFILNGEAVYEVEEITGAARLLRAADLPTAEELLRPAGSTQVADDAVMLRVPAATESGDQVKEIGQATIRSS